jgi:hypothetical protein
MLTVAATLTLTPRRRLPDRLGQTPTASVATEAGAAQKPS